MSLITAQNKKKTLMMDYSCTESTGKAGYKTLQKIAVKIKKERSYNQPLLQWKFNVRSYKEPNLKKDLLQILATKKIRFYRQPLENLEKSEVL